MSYTIPPDTRAILQNGHITDHNNIADILTLTRAAYNVKNTAYSSGAAGNGVADDTTAIQATLNAARTSTYGATVYLPAGTYLISQTLQIGSNTTLVGEGMGITTIKAVNSFAATQVGSNGGMCMLASYSNGSSPVSNVTIANLTLDGNQANIASVPGYALQALCAPFSPVNITKLAFTNVEVINSIGYATWFQSCSKVQISGCVINVGNVNSHGYTQQDGFHVTDCTGVEITGNTLSTGSNGGDDPIAIQGVSGGCTDVTITGNTILASGAHGITLNLGGGSISGVTITGNEILNTQSEGILLGFQVWNAATKITDVSITGNVLRNLALANTASGITLQDGTNVVGGGHIGAAGYANVTITGNVFEGFTNTAGFGIYAQAGANLTIMANTFSSWNAVRGIVIGDSNSGTSLRVTGFAVSGNTVDMSAASVATPYGIAVIDSPDGVVSGNTVIGHGTTGNGIWVLAISTAVTGTAVTGNRVKGWALGILEANGGAAPNYNLYVGNNLHGNTAFITTVGANNVTASNVVA